MATHVLNLLSPEKKLVALKSEAIATYYLADHLRKSVESQKLQGLPDHYINLQKKPPDIELYNFFIKRCTEIEQHGADVFKNIPTSMDLKGSNAKRVYKSLCKLTLAEIPDNVNWGRVLTLFTLAAPFAVHFTKLGDIALVVDIPQWVREVTETHLVDWIMEQGGWDDAKEKLSHKTNRSSGAWSQIVAYGGVVANLFFKLGDDNVSIDLGKVTSPDTNKFRYTFPDVTDGRPTKIQTKIQNPSPRPEIEAYSMELETHGECIIFSNEFITPARLKDGRYLQRRIGTQEDIVSLKDTFEWLGFKVVVHQNKTGAETLNILCGIGMQKQQTDDECFVCCVLSHGYNGGFYGSDATMVSTEDIKKIFEADRCPGLQGKPKLFVIQACQGDEYGKGMMILESDSPSMPIVENENENVSTHADFLFFIAATPGTVSWRIPYVGTWFVQTFCRILQKNASLFSLMDMSILINKEIAFKSQQLNKDAYAKQMSHYDSTMTKKFFFMPKSDYEKHLQKQLMAWEP